MDTGHWVLICTTLFGGLFALVQFVKKRQYENHDKIVEKKYTVYSSYLNKIDALNENLRLNTVSIFEITTKHYATIIQYPDQSQNALISMNNELSAFLKNAMQPMQILNTELNNLYLISSVELLKKLQEYQGLVNIFNDEIENALSVCSTMSPAIISEHMNKLGKSERMQRIPILHREIIELMRKEINYVK